MSAEFEALLASEQEFMVALVRTLGVPSADVPDVVQAANLYLVENNDRFEIGTNFRAWVAQIVRYRSLSYFREKKRRPMVNLSEQALDLITQEVITQFDETEAELQRLEDCMGKLPEAQRELLHWVYREGRSLKDIAKSHKQSHAAVRKTISRVRAQLKDCIESQRPS